MAKLILKENGEIKNLFKSIEDLDIFSVKDIEDIKNKVVGYTLTDKDHFNISIIDFFYVNGYKVYISFEHSYMNYFDKKGKREKIEFYPHNVTCYIWRNAKLIHDYVSTWHQVFSVDIDYQNNKEEKIQ